LEFYGINNGRYSDAVKIEDRIYCSGIQGRDPQTNTLIEGDFINRAKKCLENLAQVLSNAGVSIKHLLSLRVFVRNIRDAKIFDQALEHLLPGHEFPARTTFEVARLRGGADLEVEAVAGTDEKLIRRIGKREGAFSPAIAYGNYLFISGDIITNSHYCGTESEDFSETVKQYFSAIEKVLAEDNLTLDNLFNTWVYIGNMLDRVLVNKISSGIYKRAPLRVIVEGARFLQKRSVVIEGIATKEKFDIVTTNKGQMPTGPFSQGVAMGNMVYCSGVRSIDPATKTIVTGGFAERTNQCIKNLNAILQAGGTSWNDVFEVRVYLRNLLNQEEVYRQLSSLFTNRPMPVITIIEIVRLNEDYEIAWKPDHDIEMQCSAIKKG
jgi:enamine deaminase RidA (YjgF/YER057c/UK114 family)